MTKPQKCSKMYYKKESDYMTISLRLTDEDTNLIKAYAELNGITVSEFLRRSALERIEDEFDLKAYEDAMKEYKKNPKTYSNEEVAKLLDLE